MPFKHKAAQRHKFKKARYKVKNWKQYNEALCQRGNVTFWFSEEAIAQWTPEKTGRPGRPQLYSDTAIETGLMLRQVFHLPLRQTQGFMASLCAILDVEIPVPHYSTLSDRSDGLETTKLSQTITPGSHVIVDSSGLKVFGAGEWHETKHGLQKRRVWRKLHIAVDEKHQFIASTLTTYHEGDPGQVHILLDQLETPFSTFMADGAYDSPTVYQKILSISPEARIVIPPPKTAILPDKPEEEMSQREKHILLIKNASYCEPQINAPRL